MSRFQKVLAVIALAIGTGCSSMPRGIVSVPPYQPSNVYRPMDRLPDQFQRVLLLPLALRTSETTDPSAFETLQPVLTAELRKRNAFEVITCSREELRQWTGRDSWATSDELPANLLQQLQKRTGCDGLLFAELTHHQSYPPLAIGLNLRLVQCRGSATVWSIDETLDASNPAVASGARAYGRRELPKGAEPEWTMTHSPPLLRPLIRLAAAYNASHIIR
ncbi:MAG: hypothetical protein WCR20_00040 [Verrucomicrobiota bacterium]